MRTGYLALIVFLFVISVIPGLVLAQDPVYDKCVSIHLTFSKDTVVATSSDIRYNSAPHMLPNKGQFTAILLGSDGSVIRTFPVWDPRIQFGDQVEGSNAGDAVQSLISSTDTAESVLVFPFDPKVTEFQLFDHIGGTLLVRLDLTPAMDTFFSAYPRDPENPASLGERAPVLSPQQPQPSGIVNLLPGQFSGLLIISAGAFLIVIGTVLAAFYLRVRPRTVLLVDDNPDIIEVISIMLKMGGFTALTASSGEECLVALRKTTPDLILLDIGMEPMDGWETLRRIKKDPSTRRIPVVMLTARRLSPKDVEDYGICIEDYILKPVTPQGLTEAIDYVFNRRSMILDNVARAKGTGIDQQALCELARLTRVIDVEKRLWKTLEKTYEFEEGLKDHSSEITLGIRNVENKIRDQEQRFEQIRKTWGEGAKHWGSPSIQDN